MIYWRTEHIKQLAKLSGQDHTQGLLESNYRLERYMDIHSVSKF